MKRRFITSWSENKTKLIMDCKVIPGEAVVTQHRILVTGFSMKVERRRRKEKRKSKIKVWKLRGEEKAEFRRKVEKNIRERQEMVRFQKQ